MKLSKHIKECEEFLKQHGDLECIYATDDEGNNFYPATFEPCLMFQDANGEYMGRTDYEERYGEAPYEKVCCVN